MAIYSPAFFRRRTEQQRQILYALLGFLLIPLLWLSTLADPEAAMPIWLALLFPIIYGLFGYIFTAIGCALYNFVAARVGGIEFSLTPSSGA